MGLVISLAWRSIAGEGIVLGHRWLAAGWEGVGRQSCIAGDRSSENCIRAEACLMGRPHGHTDTRHIA
jgi:hypothetical protein